MLVAALKRHTIEMRRQAVEQRRHSYPELHDVDELEQRVAASSVPEVAAEIGVTVIAVQTALTRHGGQSAHASTP